MARQTFTGPGVSTPRGPYSPNARVGAVVATAGQVGVLPGGALAEGLEAQVRAALANLFAALAAAGAAEPDVVSVTVHLAEGADVDVVNAAYAEHFSEPFPPRTTVVAGLRPGVLFEATALAVVATPAEEGQ